MFSSKDFENGNEKRYNNLYEAVSNRDKGLNFV